MTGFAPLLKILEKFLDYPDRVCYTSDMMDQKTKDYTEFREELRRTINCHCMENGSNTPDYVLAEFLVGVLKTFDKAINQRNSSVDLLHELTEKESELAEAQAEVARLRDVLTSDSIADLLVASGLIHPLAVEDAARYDNCQTWAKICKFADALRGETK